MIIILKIFYSIFLEYIVSVWIAHFACFNFSVLDFFFFFQHMNNKIT